MITAGATREWLDKVRFLSNPSSGAMGVEIALEMWARGADVTLIAGHVSVPLPHFINTVRVGTAEEMAKAMEALTGERRFDVVIGAGAPVDFRPQRIFQGKIKSDVDVLNVEFKPTPKILSHIKRRPKVLVAFAAEAVESTADLEGPAREKMEKYEADLVVANAVGLPGIGFAASKLRALILDREEGILFEGEKHKEEIAAFITDRVSELLGGA